MNGLLRQRLRARANSVAFFAPQIAGLQVSAKNFQTDEKTRAEFKRVSKKRTSYATPSR